MTNVKRAMTIFRHCHNVFVAEKNGSFSSLFSNKRRTLCFVINVLNTKKIILLKLAEYRLILANSAYGLVAQVSGNIPADFAG